MALDSVFANSPTSVGARNKETLKHDGGEKESWQEEFSDNSDIKDAQNVSSNQMDEDDEGGGEVEEGEIVESDNEDAPPVTAESGEKSGTMGDVDKSLMNRKKKKKKKKRKKPGDGDVDKTENAGQVENKKPKKSTKKGNWYVDHDRVDEDDQWFKNNAAAKRSQNFNGEFSNNPYESPGEDFEARHAVENNRQQSQNGPQTNTGSNKGKKRKGSGSGAGSEKKRSKMTRQNFSNGKSRRRDMRHRTVCKFFLEGKCNKGSECTFLHDGTPAKKFELCKFYLNGFCAKAEKCLFMHKEFPCKFFHTGVKCYSAEQCKFSHEPLTEETRKMLERCLDANRDEDFRPNSPTAKGRPSLLGSPPRHVKEMADSIRKIPSLFDIHVGTPTSNTPMPSPPQLSPSQTVRPNFYSDTMKSPTFSGRITSEPKSPRDNSEMSTSESKDDSKEKGEDAELPFKDVDMRLYSDMSESVENNSANDDDEDSKKVDKFQSGDDSESDSSKRTPPAPIAIPTHLPKKQRELFLRIQQQQRQAENSESDKNDDKKEDELDKDENWYTSDDDDDNDGDQPLTAVLKKLQQEPPPSKQPTSTQPVFDIAKMIGLLCNNKKSALDALLPRHDDRFLDLAVDDRDMRPADTRDPRKRRMQRVDPRSEASRFADQRESWTKDQVKEPRNRESRFESRFVDQRPNSKLLEPFRDMWDNGDKDMRLVGQGRGGGVNVNFPPDVVDNYAAIPYKLQAMSISTPNYVDVMMSMSMTNPNDPRLQSDPRLKKQSKNNNITSNVDVTEDDNLVVDVRSKFPALSQNGKMSSLLGSPPRDLAMPTLPPIILPPVEPPNPFIITPAPPKPSSIRPCRPDPRQTRNLGRHSGLPDTLAEKNALKVTQSENLRTDSSTVSKNNETDIASNKAKPKGGSYQRRGSLDYASPLGYKDDTNSSTGNSYTRRPQHRRTSTLSKSASDVAVKSPPRVVSESTPSDVEVGKISDETSIKNDVDVGDKVSDLSDMSTGKDEVNCGVVDASASLKDVFKTIDPTASPFC